MRTSIPEHATLAAPLHSLMESAYKAADRRTRTAVASRRLAPFWGAAHSAALSKLLAQIATAAKLARPRPDRRLRWLTDAATAHWGSALAQMPEPQENAEAGEQPHEPQAFLSGAFTGAAASWSTPEKEALAMVESMNRLDYSAAGSEAHIYADHTMIGIDMRPK